MNTHSIKRLSFHLVWIFGLLEMITVPLVAWLPQISSLQTKSVWQGAVVGFLGIIILLFVVNKTIFKLKAQINGETITKIAILPVALWNTLLLALIFGIQKIAGLISIDFWILRYMLAGFVSVFGAVIITLSVYSIIYKWITHLRIAIKTNQHTYSIKKISVINIALLAGSYEAIALPLILLWQKAESCVALTAAITGIAGGVLGCSIIVILYNQLKILQLCIEFEKSQVK